LKPKRCERRGGGGGGGDGGGHDVNNALGGLRPCMGTVG